MKGLQMVMEEIQSIQAISEAPQGTKFDFVTPAVSPISGRSFEDSNQL